MFDSLDDHIFRIEPKSSPIWGRTDHSGRVFSKLKGQSMRKRRIRQAKPLRFTPKDPLRTIHNWQNELLFKWVRGPVVAGGLVKAAQDALYNV